MKVVPHDPAGDTSGPTAARRDAFGVALFELYVGSLYRHGLFHADPHPGNYAFRQDGRLVVYDFGCVRRYGPEVVSAFAALAEAVRKDELEAMLAALVKLGGVRPQRKEDLPHLRQLLRSFFSPLLRPGVQALALDTGAGSLAELLRDKRLLARLGLPGRLLFLFRLRFGLFSVLARLGSRADWASLEHQMATAAASGLESRENRFGG